jgi:hypothetical protein
MSFCTSFFFFLPLSPNFKQLVVDDVASFAPGGSVVAATSIPLVNDPASKTGHMYVHGEFFFLPPTSGIYFYRCRKVRTGKYLLLFETIAPGGR